MADRPSDASSGTEHCPYCPPADTQSAAAGHNGTCAYPHEAQVDGRSAGALFVALPAPTVDVGGAISTQVRTIAGVATPEPVPRVSLPVRYCRYLE
jgi:hypothetical protein